MSYTFYSFRDRSNQDEEQWRYRTLEEETRSCHGRTLEKIFTQYVISSSVKILEAGCGLGGWVNYFRKRNYQVLGIDYDERVVKKAKDFDPSIPIQQGDVTDLDFPDDSFDVYISLGVIEHFREGPQKALAEAKRIIKRGGVAFITVPYLNLFRRICVHPLRNLYFAGLKVQGKSYYFWEYRYTKRELQRFLKQSGFKVIFTGIDDYISSDKKHHIGLYADFFFLRKKHGEIWELNRLGQILLALGKKISPWLICSGLHMVAINEK